MDSDSKDCNFAVEGYYDFLFTDNIAATLEVICIQNVDDFRESSRCITAVKTLCRA